MRFSTNSGGEYLVDGDRITRLSGKQVLGPLDLPIVDEEFTWVNKPEVGYSARFVLKSSGLVVTTSRVKVVTSDLGDFR